MKKNWVLLLFLSFFMSSCIEDDYLYRIQENGLYGFIDKDGEIVIKPQYKYASVFTKDGYSTIISNIENIDDREFKITYGFINRTNELIVDTNCTLTIDTTNHIMLNLFESKDRLIEISRKFKDKKLGFKERLCKDLLLNNDRYMYQDLETRKIGYKNIKGDVIIPPIYDYGYPYDEGVAFVMIDALKELKELTESGEDIMTYLKYKNINRFKLIDIDGKNINNNRYNFVSKFDNQGQTWVRILKCDSTKMASDWIQIDRLGQICNGPIGSNVNARIYNNYYRTHLQQYLYSQDMSYNLGIFYSYIDSKGNFITDWDNDGALVLSFENPNETEYFRDAMPFSENYAAVATYINSENKYKWVFVDSVLEIKSEPYDSILPFSEGYAAVLTRKKKYGMPEWGYVDINLSEVIPFRFTSVSSFNKGLAYASIKGTAFEKEGYIDKTGEFVWSTNRIIKD